MVSSCAVLWYLDLLLKIWNSENRQRKLVVYSKQWNYGGLHTTDFDTHSHMHYWQMSMPTVKPFLFYFRTEFQHYLWLDTVFCFSCRHGVFIRGDKLHWTVYLGRDASRIFNLTGPNTSVKGTAMPFSSSSYSQSILWLDVPLWSAPMQWAHRALALLSQFHENVLSTDRPAHWFACTDKRQGRRFQIAFSSTSRTDCSTNQ